MNLRQYKPTEDHSMLAAWWKAHGFPVIPPNMLPDIGVIVENGDVPICAAFLCRDQSCALCVLVYPTANPAAPRAALPKGFALLLGFMVEHARELGFALMLTTCKQRSLVRMFQKNGFTLADKGVTHLVKPLTT